MKKKFLDRNSLSLMGIALLYQISNVFLNTFLVAYILQISNNNISTVGFYYAIMYSVMTIIFVSTGSYIKKCNRLILLRIGLFFAIILAASIILCGERLGEFFYIIAIISGLFMGFYWCVFDSLRSDSIPQENIKLYTKPHCLKL